MGTNEADLFPYNRIWSEGKTQNIEEYQAINYAWCNALLLKPEYCSGVCGCIVDKPVREKHIYLQDLQHIKTFVRGFVILKSPGNSTWLWACACINTEKNFILTSRCNRVEIFWMKNSHVMFLKTTKKQGRNKVGGATCELLITDTWRNVKKVTVA